mgnify:CR=1 FL=1
MNLSIRERELSDIRHFFVFAFSLIFYTRTWAKNMRPISVFQNYILDIDLEGMKDAQFSLLRIFDPVMRR